jgi:hypothetical protein
LLVVAVVSCAGAAVLPWRQSGVGSALAPFELARAVLAGTFGAAVPRALGLVGLAPAMACAVLLGLSVLRSARARRVGAASAGLLCGLPLVALLLMPGPDRPAVGGVFLAVALVCEVGVTIIGIGPEVAAGATRSGRRSLSPEPGTARGVPGS